MDKYTQHFTWGAGTAATASTGATGASNAVHTPGGLKVVQAYLGDSGGTAAISIYGSLFDGLNGKTSGGPYGSLLATASMSGANGMCTWSDRNAYSTIYVNVTSVTGAGAAVNAAVRCIQS